MKTVLKNQKTVSAIVALALGAMVTFVAAGNSYGVTSNEAEITFDFDETELMERAIADLSVEEFVIEEDNSKTIKIFNANNDLIETVQVGENELVEDTEAQMLLNRAEFLSEYNNTLIYKISE